MKLSHAILASLACASPAAAVAQAPPVAATVVLPRPDLRFDPRAIPNAQAVLAVLDYTAAAQIAAMKAAPFTLTGGAVDQITANWVSAAFYTGAGRLSRVSATSGALPFLRDVAEHYNYGLRGTAPARSAINADDQAIGELYQELAARSGQPALVGPLRQRLDITLSALTADPAPKQLTWWWCDALFMAPPVFARMAVQTGDPAYIQAMDTQWWRTYDRLWDPAEGLYYRDERFNTKRSASGAKIFWSRGEGWVVGGYARVLEAMPADFPSRPRYIATFRTMVERLAKLQRSDGLWTASLLDPQAPAGPESSGSAFFVYAMAWGINHGVLDRKTYLPHVLRGWAGLTGAIQPNGLLGHVQRTGDQPVPTAAEDTGFYGTGGLLLAGLEVMRLGDAPTALPLPEPERDAGFQTRPAPALRAAPTDPVARVEYDRRQQEMRATRDLAYDPAGQQAPAAATAVAATPRADGIVMPRAAFLMPPPPADAQAPRAFVALAPYRYDDILWENDRTAHRIYGHALEAFEPPSGSGIDAWGKNVRWPFTERQLKTGKQHDYHGDGIDFYNVGTGRGMGGLGIWFDNKVWASRNYRSYRILKNGPDVADFEVDYAPWPIDVDRKVWETRRFTLPMGTNFTRMTSTIKSDKPGPLVVAIGIGKRTTSQEPGKLTTDAKQGRISWWSPTDPDKGTMGLALLFDPAMLAGIKEDADNYLVLLNVTPGKPFVYYAGSAWDKGLDFHSRAEWEAYVGAQHPDFRPAAK